MAINVYTPFRADEYAYQGGAALGAGIGGGIASAGKTIFDQLLKEKEQAKQEGKLVTSIRQTLKNLDAADALKNGREPQPHKFDLMGPQQLEGEWNTIGALRAQQQDALIGAQIEKYRQQAQDEQANRQVPGFMLRGIADQQAAGMSPQDAMAGRGPMNDQNYDASMAQQAGPGSGFSPGIINYLQAASRAGAPIHPSVMDNVIAGPTMNFDPSAVINLPGAPGYQKTQTSKGQYQVLPPRELPGDKEPVMHLGAGEWNPMSGYNNNLAVTPSQYKKHKAALEDLGFKIQPAAPTTPKPVKGQKVKQDGVIYEYDGKNWIEAK